jgi:Serine dehydrogenase proteinase
MPFAERRALIKKIEETRGSSLICYLTSLRQNVPSQMAEDSVRVVFDHLLLLPARPVEKLDIFLCSNGGSGTVPWRLVALFREFSKSFSVLIPYRAYSAASLLALGADEIVMHPFAELGPIDPTVSNEFNPSDAGGRHLGISVEDVKAYVEFVKSTVGITHEDELVRTIEILAQKVHPLALGNVERFLSQSRMIATKILRTHMSEADEHTINEIVENMASKLYFHGHPINRLEAKNDLRLKVTVDLPAVLETTMWDLYKDYEQEFQNLEVFHPPGDLAAMTQGGTTSPEREYELVHAMIESDRLASRHTTRRRFRLVQVQPAQRLIEEDLLAQGWSHSPAT